MYNVRTYVHTSIHPYMHNACIYTYTHTRTYLHVHTYKHIYFCTRTYIDAEWCRYVCYLSSWWHGDNIVKAYEPCVSFYRAHVCFGGFSIGCSSAFVFADTSWFDLIWFALFLSFPLSLSLGDCNQRWFRWREAPDRVPWVLRLASARCPLPFESRATGWLWSQRGGQKDADVRRNASMSLSI